MDTPFLSEQLAVVGVIDPDAYAANTYLTGAIDMSLWHEVIFVVLAGDLGSSATVDFSVKESDASGGSYAALSPARAITQLTQAGSDDNKQVVVRVRAEELTDGKRYLKGELVVGTATSDAGVIALGGRPRHGKARDNDLSTVDEIV